VPPLGVQGSVEVSTFLGLTVQDLRGIAGRTCARADAASPASGVVELRPAAIDAEIDRLSRLRDRLAQRTGRA
jgi:hypothetical protein